MLLPLPPYVPLYLYTAATSILLRPAVSDGLGEHKSHGRMKRILEAGKEGRNTANATALLHSTPPSNQLGTDPSQRPRHSELMSYKQSDRNHHTYVLHVQDRPRRTSLTLVNPVSPLPPRIDFSHTFNTSLAPCMAKIGHNNKNGHGFSAFAFCFSLARCEAQASSSGYAAPSAFERHRRCFARDVELIPLSTCHGLSRRAVTCHKSTRN